MKLLKITISLLLVFLLTGCSVNLDDYSDTQPDFKMEEFFDGELKAYGIVQNRSGKVLRRFVVDLVGRWDGNMGVLEEDFVYDDSEEQRRVWQLEKLADGRYRGTAGDVFDSATGNSEGFAFNWQYTLAVNVDGKEWAIDLNDWIYQIDETRIVNRTEMTKWGFKVGEVFLVIEKIDS